MMEWDTEEVILFIRRYVLLYRVYMFVVCVISFRRLRIVNSWCVVSNNQLLWAADSEEARVCSTGSRFKRDCSDN
jgi:hypothetical protein